MGLIERLADFARQLRLDFLFPRWIFFRCAAQGFQSHEDQRERDGQRAKYKHEDSPVKDSPPGCGCLLTLSLRLTLTSSSGLGLTLSRRGGRGVISHPGRAASAAFGWYSYFGRGRFPLTDKTHDGLNIRFDNAVSPDRHGCPRHTIRDDLLDGKIACIRQE